jgi:hypothetical protein
MGEATHKTSNDNGCMVCLERRDMQRGLGNNDDATESSD